MPIIVLINLLLPLLQLKLQLLMGQQQELIEQLMLQPQLGPELQFIFAHLQIITKDYLSIQQLLQRVLPRLWRLKLHLGHRLLPLLMLELKPRLTFQE